MQPLLLDIGWSEMVVIAVVALIVVGPKDLPLMFRKVGQFVGKARGMARDFQRAMDQAADESGIHEVSASIEEATSNKNTGLDDVQRSMADYKSNYKTQAEVNKIDAAAEHAKRIKEQEKAAAEKAVEPSKNDGPADSEPAGAEEAKPT